MAGYQDISYPARSAQADSFAPGNDLELPGSRPRFMNFTLTGGSVYAKGSVLGMVTVGRKLKLAASAAGDGSQTPMAVLNTAVDATAGDVTFDVMVSGAVLNPAALVLGAGTTSAAAQDALRAVGFSFDVPGYSG